MISGGINFLTMIELIKEGLIHRCFHFAMAFNFNDELIWITAMHSDFSWRIYSYPDYYNVLEVLVLIKV